MPSWFGSGSPTNAVEGPERTRCLIFSDRPLIRLGVRAALADQPDLDLFGEVTQLAELWPAVDAFRPQVILADLALGRGVGIPQLREIKERIPPHVALLVLSPHAESLLAGLALEAGALGLISDRDPADTVVTAIRQVRRGRIHLDSNLVNELLGQNRTGGVSSAMRSLTAREFEVFQGIGRAETTRTIARKMGLSVHTVETYRERIRQKLGLNNGTDLMFRAIVWNLLNES